MKLFKSSISVLTILSVIMSLFSISCDRLHEEMEPCHTGLRLRFVYDRNMEFANAFPSQVDCLTLLIYDSQGKYIATETANRPETSDENWRMTLDLPAGDYTLLAYGGMDCDKASFSFTSNPETTLLRDIEVRLNPELLTSPLGKPLHHLFYGRIEANVPEAGAGTSYTDATVYMTKDTNDLRIILASENGTSVNDKDFQFTITDDDTLLGWNNDIIPAGNTIYNPWVTGNTSPGLNAQGEPYEMAFAEFSVSRLVDGSKARLLVTRVSDGATVAGIDLVKVLLMLKSERYDYMEPQEFLDRVSMWNLTFFLGGDGLWTQASIKINDWVVRFNNISDI